MELIQKAIDNDADAFIELMKQNNQMMYKTVFSILKNEDDCADAIQETILDCYENIHTLKKLKYFKTWLCRILINNCYEILRNKREALPGNDKLEAETYDQYPSDDGFN